MPGTPVKFRCYRCNQLLGVSRSKVGAVISCPKCSAELVVPEPVEASGTAADPASSALLSAIASGLSQELLTLRPEDIRVEPGVLWGHPPQSSPPPEPAPPPPESAPEPAPSPPADEAPPMLPPVELTPTGPEPILPPIQLEPPKPVERPPAPRSRDVVLPRSVVATWSLFVLLAQAMAFLAGLLAGHYLWMVHR